VHFYNHRIEVYKYAVFSTILRLHPNLNNVVHDHLEVDGADGVVSGVLRHVQDLRIAVVVPIAAKMNIIP